MPPKFPPPPDPAGFPPGGGVAGGFGGGGPVGGGPVGPPPSQKYIQLKSPTESLGLLYAYNHLQEVIVIVVDPGSPADLAEIDPGWKIVEVNGEAIKTHDDLKRAIGKVRATQLMRIPIKVQQPWDPETNGPLTPRLEFVIQVTPSEQLGLVYEEEDIGPNSCVLSISSVVPNAPADKAGIVAGLDLIRCDGERIHTKEDLQDHIEQSGVRKTGGSVVMEMSVPIARERIAQRDEMQGELIGGADGEEFDAQGDDAMYPDQFVEMLNSQLIQTKLALKRMHEQVEHAQLERNDAHRELEEIRAERYKERDRRDRRKSKRKSDGLYRQLGKIILRHERDYWHSPHAGPGPHPRPQGRTRHSPGGYDGAAWGSPALGPPGAPDAMLRISAGQPPPAVGRSWQGSGLVGGFGRAPHLTGLPYESGDVAYRRNDGRHPSHEADRLWNEGWSSVGLSRRQTHTDSWGHPARRWPSG
eukprot:Hpha_TRINITY_DN8939_c0_g1::TRINITY_DN8939_c0_g1_i2::g.80933::m.80933